ncbi:MAG: helix-hairpin-helix domain-containing protein [Kofleriaceae bacterium]|nr:helix-hairpin-helix domain-containing protein [Kofleriaceae bacterium]MCB9571358.1 helix-hairpin-helix domain-containing protein [Kofleriaceae bacterium]
MRVTLFRAALAASLVATVAAPAVANPYEAFIDIETEDDLADLLATQQISQDTYDTLIDLYYRGVDLDTASREDLYSLPNLTYDEVDRILAYRKEQGFVRDPADLVAAGVLTDDKLLAIAAFLVIRDPLAGRSAVHGFVQAQTGFTAGDDLAPPAGIRGRLLYGRHLTAGVAATLTRLRAGDVVYDPDREAMLADAPGVQLHLPKAYVAYQDDHYEAIVGNYRIGFGQRLTFDDSSDYTPNGIYRDDQLYHSTGLDRECTESTGELGASPCSSDFHYVTPDLSWREALLGAAVGAKHLELGQGWAQAYAWGSYAPRSIYQYELVNRAICDDPRLDDDPACAAPAVLVRPDGDRLQPAPALAYSTLPAMYTEALAGGNATYFVTQRNYLGVTAYGARTSWLVDDGTSGAGDPFSLDFQEWSSRPVGGEFGAIGVSAAAGLGYLDLGAEVAYSFDSMKDGAGPTAGGGGPGAVLRATLTRPKVSELEASLRYYDTDFVNPYGRPIAQPDELEGQRARDELGARLRYTGKHGRVAVRSGLDLWTNPSTDIKKGEVYGRAEVQASKAIRWGAWLDIKDKDLAEGGRGQCYDETFEFDEAGEPIDCKGMQVTSTARLRWQVDKRLTLSTQLQHQLLDSPDYPTGFRQDVSAWLIALWKPPVTGDRLRLRARLRYLSEDVADSKSLEESLWTYVDATVRLRTKDRLRVRADLFVWMDDRDRTLQRSPSPELTLWAQYEARY